MPEHNNLQRLADDNYHLYYEDEYLFSDFLILGGVVCAFLIALGLGIYFIIQRRRNRARRAQLTAVFIATNRFQMGGSTRPDANQHMLPPPAYAQYPPQGQVTIAQPETVPAGCYQYQQPAPAGQQTQH